MSFGRCPTRNPILGGGIGFRLSLGRWHGLSWHAVEGHRDTSKVRLLRTRSKYFFGSTFLPLWIISEPLSKGSKPNLFQERDSCQATFLPIHTPSFLPIPVARNSSTHFPTLTGGRLLNFDSLTLKKERTK